MCFVSVRPVCNVGVVGYSRQQVSVNKSLQNQDRPHLPKEFAVEFQADDPSQSQPVAEESVAR
jgi:hypothetical protein